MGSLFDWLAYSGARTSAGDPVASGLAYFYEPHSDTKKRVWADDEYSDPLPNPVTLDAAGRATVYGQGDYRLRIETSAGVYVMDVASLQYAELYADMVQLRNASGYSGTGDFFTGTTVDAVVQAIKTSLGGLDAKLLVTHTGGSSVLVRTWASQVFNVKLFGALGDGSTDDTSAVQAAITAANAAGGGKVYFPRGTYIIASALTGYGSIHYCGDGVGATILRTSGTATYSLFTFTTRNNVTVSDMTLQGTGTSAAATCRALYFVTDCTNVRVRDLEITGTAAGTGFNVGLSIDADRVWVDRVQISNVQASSATAGVDLTGSNEVHLNEVYVVCNAGSSSTSYGINLGTRVRATNCHVEAPSSIGFICGTESSYVGCSVQGAGSSYGFYGNGITDCRVVGCWASGGRYHYSFFNSALVSTMTRCAVVNCTSTAAGYYGVYVGSASTTPATFCKVVDCTIYNSGREAILFEGTDCCTADGNTVYDASDASAGTYGGIKVTTTNNGGHVGGNKNVVSGNYVYELTSNQMLASLVIEDYAGGSTNLGSTSVGPNTLDTCGASNVWIRFGGTNNTWKGYAVAPQTIDEALRVPIAAVSASESLSLYDSGKDIQVSGDTAVDLTLPTLDSGGWTDGLEYRITRLSATGVKRILCAGGNTVRTQATAAGAGYTIITLLAQELSGCRLTARGTVWYLTYTNLDDATIVPS